MTRERATSRRRLPKSAAGILAAGLLVAGSAGGAQVTVSAESVESAGLVARDVELRLAAGQAAATLQARAGSVEGLAELGRLVGVSLDCRQLTARDGAVRCEGHLSGTLGRAGAQDTDFVLEASAVDRARVSLARLALAGGAAKAELRLQGEAWTAQATFTGLSLEEARKLAGQQAPLPEDFALAGSLSGSLEARGRGAALTAATGALELRELAVASADGTLASDALGLDLAGSVVATRGGYDFEARVKSAGGQAYVEPWFVDLGTHPLTAEAAGRLADDGASMTLSRLRVSQGGVGSAEGGGRLEFGDRPLIAALRLSSDGVDLAAAIPLYVQPPLVSTAYRDVGGAGTVRGELEIAANQPTRLLAELAEVSIESTGGGLAVEGLEGTMNWHDEATRNRLGPQVDSAVFKSLVGWRAARLWGLEIGGAEFPFTTTGRHFRMLDPVFIPVFDGGIALDNLRIRHAGRPDMYVRFDAEIRPISVARIGRALGWPEFGGTLAGRIPRLELADGAVTLGGNLEATVFDGTVTVRDLKLRDPLGQFPQMSASIDVERLDLEQVTGTFEFGLITGKLSGRVEYLELFDWTPVRFDARFYSTPGDRTPRRISQRAVANLSSIGGGSGGSVTAAFQSGFLRFFKTFRYAELGLSCRLANDVCRMDGVAPADTGYYIVRGAGLPRIDVIGNQRRVAWTRLVRQLAAMTESSGPVVE